MAQDMDLIIFNGHFAGMQETIAAFRNARIVIGVHGGGLANTLWCGPGTLVLEGSLLEPLYNQCVVIGYAAVVQYARSLTQFVALWLSLCVSLSLT